MFTEAAIMRVERSLFPTLKPYTRAGSRNPRAWAIAIIALLICSLLPQSGAQADRMPTGSGLSSHGPLVTGSDFILASSDFKGDGSEVKESSFKKDLTLPPGSLNAS